MPLILSNNPEAPKLRQQWLAEFNLVVPNGISWEIVASADFVRLITDNVRALAAYQNELRDIATMVDCIIQDDESSAANPVERVRLNLLSLYLDNLRKWRIVATRALRQQDFADEYDSDSSESDFELPKDGWQERNNIERALNELDSCTDRLPQGWGEEPFGQEELEVVFEEEGAATTEGVGSAPPGLVDYSDTGSDTESDTDSDTDSEDDFVLTINGQPSGHRMGDVFPGGEAEEEVTATTSEFNPSLEEALNQMPPEWHAIAWLPPDQVPTREQVDAALTSMSESETINDQSTESEDEDESDESEDFAALMDEIARETEEVATAWEATNREMTGEFIDGHFVEYAE